METQQDKTFGDWLLERRKLAGKTQSEVAAAAGCSKQYISNLEHNVKRPIGTALVRPSIEIVDGIAAYLGAPISEARLAAGYAPLSHQMDEETRTLVSYFQGLPDEAREFLKAQLAALYKRYGGSRTNPASHMGSQSQSELPPAIQRLDQLQSAIRKKAILFYSESGNAEPLNDIIEILRRATFELNILRKNGEEARLAAADPTYIPKTYRRQELSGIPLTQEDPANKSGGKQTEVNTTTTKKKRA